MATSTDTRMAWEVVADHLDSLGLKLKLHFEQAREGERPGREISDAFRRLGTAIESTFSAIGAAVEDPAVREDANKLAAALGDALADTLSESAQELTAAANGLRHQRSKAQNEVAEGSADKA